ncbi:MAG: UDP-2,3-diacylglucosamine diphosphatase [Alistipes sp.]|nr:UDP-2,3-diacylglucosamine diphosphatase [Alistipes sp.]
MIYFASDVHLGSGDPAAARTVERRFLAWLDFAARDAEAIFLVGDIFDFWFEYPDKAPSGFESTLNKLTELTDRGIRVVFFTGNHDMWTGKCLADECGLEIHTEPQVMELHGKRLFIAHGDNMQIDDQLKLRLLNRMFRSRKLRWLVTKLFPYDSLIRLGRRWSGHSRKSHTKEIDVEMTRPLITYARNYAATHADCPVAHFVFGHMHVARDYHEEGLHTVHLGSWDKTPTYAVLDDAGNLTLNRFDE